jgi:hypothetical protein
MEPVDPVAPDPSRAAPDLNTNGDRLARELREAAESARQGGQPALARQLDERVEVLQWASSLRREQDEANA